MVSMPNSARKFLNPVATYRPPRLRFQIDQTAETAPRDAFRKPGSRLKKSFFARSVHQVAPDLIGATFLVNGVGGIIVEVEAYDQTNPAARSFRGPTPRNMVMFGPPGYTYVYLSYGLNRYANFVCEAAGSAAQCVGAAGSRARRRCAPAPASYARRLRSRKRSANCPWTGRRLRCTPAAVKLK
jgi:hypothetical protein